MKEEVPVSLFRFQKWETVIGLVIGVLVSSLVMLFSKKIFYEAPCPGTLFSTEHQTGLPALMMMPLVFWAAIGVTRFVRNAQRYVMPPDSISRIAHLSFLIPVLLFLLFVGGAVGAILAGPILIFILIATIYSTSNQLLVSHIFILLGQIVVGVIFLVIFFIASFSMMMADFMWCLL